MLAIRIDGGIGFFLKEGPKESQAGWRCVAYVYNDQHPRVALEVVVACLLGVGYQEPILETENLPWLFSFAYPTVTYPTVFDFSSSGDDVEGVRRWEEAGRPGGPNGFESESQALEWILVHRPEWVLDKTSEVDV